MISPERLEEIRKRYAAYGHTKNLDKNCAARHIRELLEALEEKDNK